MAVNFLIKNVPQELADQLRARAKRHHRSLQEELLAILEDALCHTPLSLEEAYQQKLGLKTKSESVAMIRKDRDGR
ncbi:MAG: Arc family DNA-binding protein [Candidatus Bipolaricaulota bacterium]|nr:Arc family DNA-binding protein [Candidatus Bipolaricaulota bacterium]MDW8329135.1 Arc family DNA-binding protein [Candidatus Bipolaricaulota bacterium]